MNHMLTMFFQPTVNLSDSGTIHRIVPFYQEEGLIESITFITYSCSTNLSNKLQREASGFKLYLINSFFFFLVIRLFPSKCLETLNAL